jgi:hypothetical protein
MRGERRSEPQRTRRTRREEKKKVQDLQDFYGIYRIGGSREACPVMPESVWY